MISLIETEQNPITEALVTEESQSLRVEVEFKQNEVSKIDCTYDPDRTQEVINFTQPWFYREPEKLNAEMNASTIK